MSKDKGSRYEREFVRLVQDAGLPAERMPLSGALGGKYRDDVLVCDTWRVECKYRADATGFKRLYEWLGSHRQLSLACGQQLWLVYPIDEWLLRIRREVDGMGTEYAAEDVCIVELASGLSQMGRWIGGADCLAMRASRMPWLIAERLP